MRKYNLVDIALALVIVPFVTLLGSLGLYAYYNAMNDVAQLPMPPIVNILLGLLGIVGMVGMIVGVPLGITLLVVAAIRAARAHEESTPLLHTGR